ncbi:MAG TPA: hypothetical protein VFA46_18445 [Actinomycetes bacterium]|nr:hypothetical protein [Actinomycetes bacterium]
MITLPVNTSLPQPNPAGKPHHHAHTPVPGSAGTLPRTTAEFEFRLSYPPGVRVSYRELAAVPLQRHDWHGEWNHTVLPSAA